MSPIRKGGEVIFQVGDVLGMCGIENTELVQNSKKLKFSINHMCAINMQRLFFIYLEIVHKHIIYVLFIIINNNYLLMIKEKKP